MWTPSSDSAASSIGSGRWSAAFKQQLRDSRIIPTEVLAEGVERSGVPVFVSASATGFYGDTGQHAVTESAPRARASWPTWRRTGRPRRERRPALGSSACARRPCSPATAVYWTGCARSRIGLGGSMGSGRAVLLVDLTADEVGAITRALTDSTVSGPINLSAPQQVHYSEFNTLLGKQLHRPSLFRVPGPVAKLAGGEMAQELIIVSSGWNRPR
ncbi:MAG: hypothetical protein QM703_19145 [Gemmatales bacterium]